MNRNRTRTTLSPSALRKRLLTTRVGSGGLAGCVQRRGMTVVEFLLAILITAIIAAAASAMIFAVSKATELDANFRETVVRSQALNVRLTSYITPGRCILDSTSSSLVVWLDDSRQNSVVNTTEVRWIRYDADAGKVILYYVQFPDSMSQVDKDTLDVELPAGTDYWAIEQSMAALGYIATTNLGDKVAQLTVVRDPATTQGKRLATISITYDSSIGGDCIVLAASIRDYEEPAS